MREGELEEVSHKDAPAMAIYMRIPALKKTVLPEILLCYSFMENYCFLIREKITNEEPVEY